MTAAGTVLSLIEEQNRCVLNHVVVKMSELSGVKMAHAQHRLPKIKEHLIIVAAGLKRPCAMCARPSRWIS